MGGDGTLRSSGRLDGDREGGGPGVHTGGDQRGGGPGRRVAVRKADRSDSAARLCPGSLVIRPALTPGFAALALGIALVLGAIHALAPGHGRTMMATAAAAGGHRSRRDIFVLGASVTVTHTLDVFALGALVTAGSAATQATTLG